MFMYLFLVVSILRPSIINMIYIYVFLSALTIVEVKTLDIVGHVGKNVTVECSDWNVWTNVNFNVKYLCESPCSEDKHIIIKAEYGQTKNNNRIELTNRENGLFVTFTNLTMSDSRKYYCGVERYGHDSFIEVNLNITDNGSDVTTDKAYTDFHTTAPTASPTQGSGNAPYWIIGLIFILIIVIVLLIHTRRMTKKKLMSTPHKDIGGSVDPDGVYQSFHPSMEDKSQVYSTLTLTKRSAASDEVYEILQPSTRDLDQVYSTLEPTMANADLE